MSLTYYTLEEGALHARIWNQGEAIPHDSAWIDLFGPTREEELAVEHCLGFDVPTREEMGEIELSNRLYEDAGHVFMTAAVLTQFDTDPHLQAVTFVVSEQRLITVRYADPLPFRTFPMRMARVALELNGAGLFTGLIETVVNRAADILETIAQDVDCIAQQVFASTKKPQGENSQKALTNLGQRGDITSKARESLTSLWRVVSYAEQNLKCLTPEMRASLTAQRHDIAALNDHAAFISNKLAFLLDATLGMINIEQNNIIKIFSIAAVVFLPPTLVASIYGMNFHHMPELDWRLGYPMAIGLMIIAAVIPIWYFKRKKWL